jgi:hypothetical protein
MSQAIVGVGPEVPMTEAEWLSCADPRSMLKVVRGEVSDRKLRVFCLACLERLWPYRKVPSAWSMTWGLLTGGAPGLPLDLTRLEAMVEGMTSALISHKRRMRIEPLHATQRSAFSAAWRTCSEVAYATAPHIFATDDWSARKAANDRAFAAEAEILREVVGNPFRPVAFDPAWRTPDVTSLAQAAYHELLPGGELDPHRLGVLADALEDVGAAGEILHHLRGNGPHVRGCWAVDLCLGKA